MNFAVDQAVACIFGHFMPGNRTSVGVSFLSTDVKILGRVAVLMGGRMRTGRAGAPRSGDVTPKRDVGRSKDEVKLGC